MVDKIDILSNFDIENNLSDCSSDENLSELSLSDTSSENCFEECTNDPTDRNSDMEFEFFKRETVEVKKSSENNETLMDERLRKLEDSSVKSGLTYNFPDNTSVKSERTYKSPDNSSVKSDRIYKSPDNSSVKSDRIYKSPDNSSVKSECSYKITDNSSVKSENTYSVKSTKDKGSNVRSNVLFEMESDINEQGNNEPKSSESIDNILNNNIRSSENELSFNVSEVDSNDFRNDEFDRIEQSFQTDYNQYLNSPPSINSDKNGDFDEFSRSKDSLTRDGNGNYPETQTMTPDEKRFQNLQEEINLLNILMFEAENQTEKCGSLYNSFTNEINNNLAYSKAGVVDDCTGSIASMVDGSKFDILSVKSELLFSEYGKSESNFDPSDNRDQEKMDKAMFDDLETKSVSSTVQTMSVDTNSSNCKSCKECEADKTGSKTKSSEKIAYLSNEDRIILLWNQIIRLKCSLKNLQLNLKEQQMETLMQINEFLINQNINSNQKLNSKSLSSSSCTLFDRNKDTNIHENLSDTSLIFTENNKIREDIALNNLKIALIECNMLSSTASSLVDSIPKYESSGTDFSKSKISSPLSSKSCCCERIKRTTSCSCPSKVKSLRSCSKSNMRVKSNDNYNFKRHSFKNNATNVDDKTDRKVKSHEEIVNKFPDTKYSLSEVRLDEISPRACI